MRTYTVFLSESKSGGRQWTVDITERYHTHYTRSYHLLKSTSPCTFEEHFWLFVGLVESAS